jgi:hypothetical protein
MVKFASGWNSPRQAGLQMATSPEGYLSIMAEGTWKTCVYVLVVSEGGEGRITGGQERRGSGQGRLTGPLHS